MQSFNFGLRQSADSMNDGQSRYAPSSIYSGLVNDSRVPSTAAPFTPMALQGPFQESQPLQNGVCSYLGCRGLANKDR